MQFWSSCAIILSAAAVFAQQQTPTTPAAPAASTTDPKDLAVIEGRTVDAAGNPIRKTVLTLRPLNARPGEMPTPYSTTSNADGNFSFNGVEPGRYTLMADHPGYLRQAYGSRKNSMMGTSLTLTAGQKMTGLNFPLMPQAVISGKVSDDEGDPVGRAQVRLLRSMYMNGKRRQMPAGGASSDESGEFKITNVAPGRYLLSALPQRNGMFESTRKAGPAADDAEKPEEDFVTTYYPGVTDGAAATTIEIVSGQNLAGTNIRLRKSPVFRIKGKLAGGTSDERTQRLRVTVLQRDAPFVDFGGTSASIAKDGSFELTGIPPGSYTLAAMATNGMFKILARQPVDIANRNIDTVLLSIQPTNTVQGSIKVEGQAASSATQTPTDLSTIRVNLVATDGTAFNMPNATVKGDGTFSLSDVPAGNYRVNVVSLPDGAYLKSIRYENQDLLASAVNIAQSGGSLQIGLSTAAGEVNGSVTTDQQQPAAGALVTLVPDPVVPDQTLLNRTSTADQNGQFTLKNLAPGKYRLYAWEDVENGAPYDPEFLKPIENLGTKIIMEENGRQQVSVPRITTAQIEQSKLK